MPAATGAIIAGAAVAAGAGIAMSQGGPDMPEGRNYAAETRDTLQAKIDLAPQMYAAEREYRPKYNALEFEENMAFLLGRQGGQRTEEYWDFIPGEGGGVGAGNVGGRGSAAFDEDGTFKGYNRNNLPGARTGAGAVSGGGGTSGQRVLKTRTVDVPAQRGFLDLLANDISPRLREIQSADRAAEIEDVRRLGPKAQQALREANPAAAAIVDELLAEAGANARGELGAGERRDIQQAIREAQAARGVGYGPSDTYGEVYGSGIASRELAFNKGAKALGMSDAFYGQPFERVLGRSGTTNAAGGLMALAGQGSAGGPRLFDPESAYASDLFNTNFNASSAAAISARNNRSAIAGSLIGMGGSLGGGYLAGRY